jgi:hypothetical protein
MGESLPTPCEARLLCGAFLFRSRECATDANGRHYLARHLYGRDRRGIGHAARYGQSPLSGRAVTPARAKRRFQRCGNASQS